MVRGPVRRGLLLQEPGRESKGSRNRVRACVARRRLDQRSLCHSRSEPAGYRPRLVHAQSRLPLRGRSGKGDGKMKRALFSLLMTLPSLGLVNAQTANRNAARPVAVRIELVAIHDDGALERCEVPAAGTGLLTVWATLGNSAPSGNAYEVKDSQARCGTGGFHVAALMAAGGDAGPLLVYDITANSIFDGGPMDPGPGVGM